MRIPLLRLKSLLLVSVLLWGCSNANESAYTVDASGKHPSDWITAHGPSYLNDATNCTGCHGATLTGGISGVSCSSTSFNGQSCHGSGPHPVPWLTHNTVPNQLNSCSPCHGAGLAGGTAAPACAQCHIQLLPGEVPVLGTCISCHGTPPNGAVYPNISAVHNAHTSLPLPPVSSATSNNLCNTCHLGGGSGSPTHGTSLTVAFPTAYNAKTANAAYNSVAGSCANVSCHGAVTTPPWRGGRINPLTQCIICHQAGTAPGVPQANSYYSGKHTKHLVDIGLVCTDCHDMSVVSGTASHFSGLNTPVFELPPASTMRTQLNFNSGTVSCSPGTSPPAGSFSIGVCHAAKNW
jgi:predicted CxxxxCH...CXXCH cytochrome family protein